MHFFKSCMHYVFGQDSGNEKLASGYHVRELEAESFVGLGI